MMSFPSNPLSPPFHIADIPTIRVVHRGNLPPGVNVGLPPTDGGRTAEADRIPGRIYIEDSMPTNGDHHFELGYFLSCWGGVETNLKFLLRFLMRDANSRSAFKIFNGLGMRQVIDLLHSYAVSELEDADLKEFEALMERVGKLNGKRNVLVHGHWIFEIVVWGLKGQVYHKGILLRQQTPNDDRLSDKIADFRNQNVRVKYCFTLKRMRSASKDAVVLRKDIGEFLTSRKLKALTTSYPQQNHYKITVS